MGPHVLALLAPVRLAFAKTGLDDIIDWRCQVGGMNLTKPVLNRRGCVLFIFDRPLLTAPGVLNLLASGASSFELPSPHTG
jgi:hypothetical protein